MVRMAALASIDGNRQKEVEFCRKVLLQLVMYLYYGESPAAAAAAPPPPSRALSLARCSPSGHETPEH